MNIEFREKFCRYYIVDNLLPQDVLKTAIEYSIANIPNMSKGTVGAYGVSLLAPAHKNNLNLWLEHDSVLHNIIETYINKLPLESLIPSKGRSLLSAYYNDGHYSWHKDTAKGMTFNYMFTSEPTAFSGGAFVLGSKDNIKYTDAVPFRNNRMIIFPADVWHSVEKVTIENDSPQNFRYSLQYWTAE